MVLAYTISGEALVWGFYCNGKIIQMPRFVQSFDYPREVFANGTMKDSGGPVFPGS